MPDRIINMAMVGLMGQVLSVRLLQVTSEKKLSQTQMSIMIILTHLQAYYH